MTVSLFQNQANKAFLAIFNYTKAFYEEVPNKSPQQKTILDQLKKIENKEASLKTKKEKFFKIIKNDSKIYTLLIQKLRKCEEQLEALVISKLPLIETVIPSDTVTQPLQEELILPKSIKFD